VDTGYAQQSVLNSAINNDETCLNCIEMKSQFNNAFLELKSLQTIIELLQKEREQNNAASVQVKCQNLPVEYSCDEYDSVKSVSVKASSSNFQVLKKAVLMLEMMVPK
jgi:hypothetical protein